MTAYRGRSAMAANPTQSEAGRATSVKLLTPAVICHFLPKSGAGEQKAAPRTRSLTDEPWSRPAALNSYPRSAGPSCWSTSASAARPRSRNLSEAIGISLSTVRRDLEHLEARGYLERSHGGALIQKQLQSTFEPEAAITAEFDRPEKELIGLAAAATLHSGASVIFDSSSTVLAAARASVERDIALTAVTNDLGIGQALSASSRIRVLCLGGTVRPESLTVLGEPGESFLGNLRVDVAFIGTHAISGLALTETSLEAAAMKRAMISAARRIVVLADASKFGAAAFCKICELMRSTS